MRITYCYLVAIVLALAGSPRPASAQDGVPPTLVQKRFGSPEGSPALAEEIAQTRDGFLWMVGGGANLVRFDGRNFFQFDKLEAVGTVAAAPDGDLWVGETSRLLRVPAATLAGFAFSGVEVHTFAEPGLRITHLQFSKQGALWIGTTGGLFRFDQNRVHAIGPRVAVRQIRETPTGRILVTTVSGFLSIVGSSVSQPQLPPGALGIKDGQIIDFLDDTHGVTWYLTPLGIARQSRGQIERLAPYGPNNPVSFRVHEDARGRIWIAKETGLFRMAATGLELVAPGMQVRDLFNDRDGNLWVGTYGDGLYRFKEAAVRMLTSADGLPGSNIMKVIEARDGTIWAGANCGGIARFDGRRFQGLSNKDGLSSACVVGLAEDGDRDLWVGTGFGAFRYRNGVFEHVSKSDGLPDERITHILHARDGSLWFGTLNGGISRLKDGRMRTFTTADGLPANYITRAFQDRSGVLWVGTPQGVARLVNERFEAVSWVPKTNAFPVGNDRDGGFYVTYRAGRGDVTVRVDPAGKATPVGLDVASMIETSNGELWIGGSTFARVWPGQLSRPGRPDDPLDQETFSIEDGLAADTAQSGAFYEMILARDGTIWAATPGGVVMFDPKRFPITRANPLVYLAGVTIGRSTVRPEQDIVLPPGTGRVEIDFAAVEISAPEKIRMQYRLDGVDSEWLNAGVVPRAIYSTLPPGRHTLRIRATNRSGIWDREGVAFSVTQQPFFYQTGWFVATIVASLLLVIAALYRRRVHHISQAMNTRFDERLAERTRVARDIHDTFLQTVQGSKMVADHALRDPSDHARMVRAMEQVSGWLGQATEEGRAALNSLRASTTETNDLAAALRRAIDDCRPSGEVNASLTVTGGSKAMHPIVRDEVYRIGYEAIRNACVHSAAPRVEVTLDYGRDLTMRVSDNGVGMDTSLAERGRDGHFGLRGMHERAARIGGRFTVASTQGSGTVITLIVPGGSAFAAIGGDRA